MNSIHILKHYYFKAHFLIILSYKLRSPKFSSFQVFRLNFYVFIIFCTWDTCPAHHIRIRKGVIKFRDWFFQLYVTPVNQIYHPSDSKEILQASATRWIMSGTFLSGCCSAVAMKIQFSPTFSEISLPSGYFSVFMQSSVNIMGLRAVSLLTDWLTNELTN
jgi:hypothetical protein